MEMWRVLNVLHDNNIIIIMQAANTSLTEGSVPAPGYDRSAVVVNGMKIKDFALLVMTFFLPTTLTSSSTKSILTSPLYNVYKKTF
ncbi:hypothetical protein BMS84_08480 [Leuconostoc pseudomesenteroides]|nr:hypothetical protein BMS84_08480 [Leuconostoc pseudomesenteroides]